MKIEKISKNKIEEIKMLKSIQSKNKLKKRN